MVTTSGISGIAQASERINKYKSTPVGNTLYNTPAKNLVLPGLLLGNMAYKMGTEKNPRKRSNILINSLASWVGGAGLVKLHNVVLPYYFLPALAGTIALFQIAQKDTPQEKTDTAVNHATWWFSGIMAQNIAKLAKLKTPFQSICAFAVGASIAGPIIAHVIKKKIVPSFFNQQVAQNLETMKPDYGIGQKATPNFSPFYGEPAPVDNANIAASMLSPTRSGNGLTEFDPYNLNELIPGGFLK